MVPLDDVIAAIATPIGEGGLSVIRISGRDAIAVADRGFRGRTSLTTVGSHTVHFGHYVDQSGEKVDEVMAAVFRAPHSYTAEDVVEISCHGGLYVTRKLLDVILGQGARAAQPGEFTKRAFLNGRIDLSQAEAVADMIAARSETSRHTSVSQLQGRLSDKITNIRNDLLDACVQLELELDFSEEGLETVNKHELTERLNRIIQEVSYLIDSYDIGKTYRDGVKVVIAGKPNVGKSSLLNALLMRDRAIVTHVSGTTRDLIEENLLIGGNLVRLVDTAGVTHTQDIVEMEGIRLTEREIGDSDVVLFLVDNTGPITQEDISAFEKVLQATDPRHRNIIITINKIDLPCFQEKLEMTGKMREFLQVRISAKANIGIEELKTVIAEKIGKEVHTASERSLVVTNARHRNCLISAKDSLSVASESLAAGRSNEFVSADIRSAAGFLAEITGAITSEEVLNHIFSKFCIGK